MLETCHHAGNLLLLLTDGGQFALNVRKLFLCKCGFTMANRKLSSELGSSFLHRWRLFNVFFDIVVVWFAVRFVLALAFGTWPAQVLGLLD
jgi:hypothetical protein